jgi:hypothetical protein
MNLPFTVDEKTWIVALPVLLIIHLVSRSKYSTFILEFFTQATIHKVEFYSKTLKLSTPIDEYKIKSQWRTSYYIMMTIMIITSLLCMGVFFNIIKNPPSPYDNIDKEISDYNIITDDHMLKVELKDGR